MDILDQLAPDCLYATDQDMWVRLYPDGTVRVGATHLVSAHGQFMLFTPRPNGTEVEKDRSMGVMETAKTAVAIHAPISCRILEANPVALDNINYVTGDPYGGGWLFRVEPLAFEAERKELLDAASYRAWLEPRLSEKVRNPIDEFRVEDFDIDPHRGY